MKDNLIARQLRRLGLAYEIQKVANPILKRGDTSQTSIYYNEILKKFAVCENTFRSLVKLKEAENFPTLLAEYRNRQKARSGTSGTPAQKTDKAEITPRCTSDQGTCFSKKYLSYPMPPFRHRWRCRQENRSMERVAP